MSVLTDSNAKDAASTDGSGRATESRSVVTLSPSVTTAVRRMGAEMDDAGSAEVVRRGLMLLDFFLSLPDDEELVVRNRRNQQVERVRFAWDTF
jgi:hypothetical protein